MVRSLFLSILFFLGCVSVSLAQEYNAKFSPGLFYMSTNTVTQSGYMTALEFEALLNSNMSVNGGLNFFTGGGTLGMFIKPELRFTLRMLLYGVCILAPMQAWVLKADCSYWQEGVLATSTFLVNTLCRFLEAHH